MLALSAMQAGDGALASIAVQRALQADPTDHLAHVLGAAIAGGIDPATITALLAG
jgi:Tfp pilus assembly protein PilF